MTSNPPSGCLLKKSENLCFHTTNVYLNIYSDFIHNYQKLETTEMFQLVKD